MSGPCRSLCDVTGNAFDLDTMNLDTTNLNMTSQNIVSQREPDGDIIDEATAEFRVVEAVEPAIVEPASVEPASVESPVVESPVVVVAGADADRVWLRRRAFRDATAVLRTALRLLARHWPALFALSFAGLAARAFLTVAAVRVGRFESLAGLLVFVLVPITTLTALILMLRVLRYSLPWLRTVPDPARQRRSIDVIGSVLVPFLAVYASYGYLQADQNSYFYALWFSDPTRKLRSPSHLLVIAVVAAAFGLRAFLGWWSVSRRRPWFGVVRAYLEVIWIGIGASLVEAFQEQGWSWLSARRVVHGGAQAVRDLGGVSDPVHRLLGWAGTLLGSGDTVIVVPIAWLAVGAVIYGRKIADESDPRDAALARKVARQWIRLPRFVRRILAYFRDGASERFGPLVQGVRVLFRAGLGSMLLFCLLFLVTQTASVWLFELERALIGPRDLFHFWMPLSQPLSVLNDGLSTVLLACLLGAAIDRVLRAQAAASGLRQPATVTAADVVSPG